MREAKIALLVLGGLAFVIGAVMGLASLGEPDTVTIATVARGESQTGEIRLTGSHGDLGRAALRFDDETPVLALVPLGEPGIVGLAPALLVTEDPVVLGRFSRDGADRVLARDVVGRVVRMAEARERWPLELVRLENELASSAVILEEGGSTGALWPMLVAVLALGSAFVLHRRGDAPRSRLPVAARPSERPAPVRVAPSRTVPEPPKPSPPRRPTIQDLDECQFPAEPLFGRVDEPFEESPFPEVEEPRGAPSVTPPQAPVARSAPAVVSTPPFEPSEADVKRRLFDYSSIATVGSDELLKRFRFVAQKIAFLDDRLRVFPMTGRPFEASWDGVKTIVAYRCPDLTPWSSLLVAELHVAGDGGGVRPVRLVTRTALDLGEELAERAKSGGDLLRLALREIVIRAPKVDVDDATRRYLATGAEPPQMASLRALAEHDARFA